ncbi:MAG: LPS assembly protein LptD, partial [Desulfobulbaceae bacterium]|nr:LPS assembly protein LptD [Desulfobulbaceae bacterium]
MHHKILFPPIVTLFLTLSLCFLFGVPESRAGAVKAEQWEITADKITRYEDPPSIIAEGNVVLEKTESVTRKKKEKEVSGWSTLLEEEPVETVEEEKAEEAETVTETKTLTTIRADWAAYDVNLGTVKARGNLIIDVGPDQLTAESGTVDLNNETGTFNNAVIIRQYKDLHLEGKVIEKTGDLTYHIEDGWIISCKVKEGETPPWSFGSADAKITDGGYAFLKHATFRIKGVPVFYSPVMLLPAKHSRQTGFLFPSISSSDRDGFGFEAPFFINLSPSSDITLYPQYMANRGFMAGGEFRYLLDQNSKGSLMANYLDDDLSDPSETEYYQDGNYTHTNKDRYWVRGKADQDLGPWISRVDLDIVSDRDYLTEFNSGITGFTTSQNTFMETFGRGFQNMTEDQRTNSLRVLRSWGNGISLQGDLMGINDIRESKDSPTPLWTLPALNFTGLLPVYETGVDFSWDADYVYYWRDQGVRSQRVDLFPRLSMAVPLSSYLETTVDAGVRDT